MALCTDYWQILSHSALLSNCTFDFHCLLWMTRTWSAHLSLPYSTCGWEHFGSHGIDGTLHPFMCSSDNLYFGASRSLKLYIPMRVAVFLMKAHLFLLRHNVFKKIEQHTESLGAYFCPNPNAFICAQERQFFGWEGQPALQVMACPCCTAWFSLILLWCSLGAS